MGRRGDTPSSPAPALGGPVLGLALTAYVLHWLCGVVADPDLWGYLAFGRLFWRGDGFPYRDVFSYVPTLEPWVYHEWLTGVIFFPIYEHLGGAGLQALKFALGLATAGLVWRVARERGASPATAGVALFLAGGVFRLGYSPVRAQVFTFFFFALTALLLERARRQGRWGRLAWLVPLQVLWANLHGGFPAGLGLMALYALGQALARRPALPLLLALAAAAAATLLNPYGPALWTYLAQALTMPRPEISEWLSVWQAMEQGMPSRAWVLGPLLAALSLAFLLALRWPDATVWLVLAVTAGLGLAHLRHQPFLLLGFVMFFPSLLEECLGRLRRARAGLEGPGPAWPRTLISPLLLGLALWWGFQTLNAAPWRLETPAGSQSGEEVGYPVAAVEYIERQGLSGRILPQFQWGEHLLWRLHPVCRVGMDGRYETVYPADYCRGYFNFLRAGPGWREFLASHAPDMILLDPQMPVAALLGRDPGWRLVLSTPGEALFLRQGPGG